MSAQKGAYVLFISWRGGVALVYGFAKKCALGFKPFLHVVLSCCRALSWQRQGDLVLFKHFICRQNKLQSLSHTHIRRGLRLATFCKGSKRQS